jgi:hypothetical protein
MDTIDVWGEERLDGVQGYIFDALHVAIEVSQEPLSRVARTFRSVRGSKVPWSSFGKLTEEVHEHASTDILARSPSQLSSQNAVKTASTANLSAFSSPPLDPARCRQM